MDPSKKKRRMRIKRHRHARKSLEGTPAQPRLCVFRSNTHIYAQVIDDWNGNTLLSLSSLDPELKSELEDVSRTEAAGLLGRKLGAQCIEAGIEKLVFDRSGYKYHGRVKALAEGVREEFSEEGKQRVF